MLKLARRQTIVWAFVVVSSLVAVSSLVVVSAVRHTLTPASVDLRFDTGDNQFSGYIVGSGSGNGFKGAQAKWNAPCTNGTIDHNHQYGSWVGLGGWFAGEPLEQAGIALQTNGTYLLFWEYAPYNAPYYDRNDVVHCGDHLLAWVHYGYSYCSNGGFYAHVEDDTTGAHLGSTCLTESRGYGHQSADWIDERPGCQGGAYYADMADFHYSQWTNVLAQANYSGASWTNFTGFANTLVYDFDANKQIGQPGYIVAEPGVPNSDGKSYTDYWYDPGTDGNC